jgi:hypothetical protein
LGLGISLNKQNNEFSGNKILTCSFYCSEINTAVPLMVTEIPITSQRLKRVVKLETSVEYSMVRLFQVREDNHLFAIAPFAVVHEPDFPWKIHDSPR